MPSVVCQPHVSADQRSLTSNLNDLVQTFASAQVRTLGDSLERVGFRISGSPIERLGLMAEDITGRTLRADRNSTPFRLLPGYGYRAGKKSCPNRGPA